MPDGVLSPAEAAECIRRLEPGASFAYFVGDIAVERAARERGVLTERALSVASLADFMTTHGRHGEILGDDNTPIRCWGSGILTQKRLGRSVYCYVFTKGG